MANALEELGISREDVLDRAVDRLLEGFDDDNGSLANSVRSKVITEMLKQAGSKIDAILGAALNEIVDFQFTPVDEWGEKTKKTPTSLREMVKDKALKFLSEKVNKEGTACSYNPVGTRAEFLAKKAAVESMTYEVKSELTKAIDTAKAELKNQVAKHIAEVLLKK